MMEKKLHGAILGLHLIHLLDENMVIISERLTLSFLYLILDYLIPGFSWHIQTEYYPNSLSCIM